MHYNVCAKKSLNLATRWCKWINKPVRKETSVAKKPKTNQPPPTPHKNLKQNNSKQAGNCSHSSVIPIIKKRKNFCSKNYNWLKKERNKHCSVIFGRNSLCVCNLCRIVLERLNRKNKELGEGRIPFLFFTQIISFYWK